jgi:hypothetical protein
MQSSLMKTTLTVESYQGPNAQPYTTICSTDAEGIQEVLACIVAGLRAASWLEPTIIDGMSRVVAEYEEMHPCV